MINRTDPKQGDAWEGVPEVTDRVDLAPLLAGETGAGVGASRTMSNVRACVCVFVSKLTIEFVIYIDRLTYNNFPTFFASQSTFLLMPYYCQWSEIMKTKHRFFNLDWKHNSI